jgi:hypothetical protein
MAARDQYGEIFFDEKGRRLLLSRKNDQMLFDYYAGLERRRGEKPALQPILELTNPLPKTPMSESQPSNSKQPENARPGGKYAKAEAQSSQTSDQKPAPETTEKTVAFADTDEVKSLGTGGGQKQKGGYNEGDRNQDINNDNENNMESEQFNTQRAQEIKASTRNSERAKILAKIDEKNWKAEQSLLKKQASSGVAGKSIKYGLLSLLGLGGVAATEIASNHITGKGVLAHVGNAIDSVSKSTKDALAPKSESANSSKVTADTEVNDRSEDDIDAQIETDSQQADSNIAAFEEPNFLPKAEMGAVNTGEEDAKLMAEDLKSGTLEEIVVPNAQGQKSVEVAVLFLDTSISDYFNGGSFVREHVDAIKTSIISNAKDELPPNVVASDIKTRVYSLPVGADGKAYFSIPNIIHFPDGKTFNAQGANNEFFVSVCCKIDETTSTSIVRSVDGAKTHVNGTWQAPFRFKIWGADKLMEGYRTDGKPTEAALPE